MMQAAARQLAQQLKRPASLDIGLGLALFVASFAVYNATLTPSLSFASPDGNELATVPHELGLLHSPGYPLYTWVGKLFSYLPVGDVAHRLNLMSAAGAAGTAALVYGLLRLVVVGRLAALFGGLFLAFSVTLWSQAVIAEVYAPNAFMMALTLFLLVAWARREEGRGAPEESDLASTLLFYGFALSYGLSLGTHLSNLAFAPAFALFILLVNWRVLAQPLTFVVAVALFVLGASQYVWLPMKASTLNDVLMVRNAPDTWEGFYNYTLNAFSGMRLAFPLEAIPDRIVLYLQLAKDNFGPWGLGLALVGMWGMLWRRTKVFYLLVLIYLAEVAFYVQYAAFDIEVFFVPAHIITVLFAAYAVHLALDLGLPRMALPPVRLGTAYAALGLVALVPVAWQIPAGWSANDQSANTAINDFYDQVFDVLPPDSVLMGWRGVFGYDMFYFRYVYDARPDVLMPLAEPGAAVRPDEMSAGGRRLFTTVSPRSLPGGFGPPAFTAVELLRQDLWYVPVLAAPMASQGTMLSRSLVLYEARDEPPELIVSDAEPDHLLNRDLGGGLRLVGYDISGTQVAPGGRLHVVFYWKAERPGAFFVSTMLGDGDYRETHELGFGNLVLSLINNDGF